MAANTTLTRRDFLKLLQVNALSLLIPARISDFGKDLARWPAIELSELPSRIRSILALVPPVTIDAQGSVILSQDIRAAYRRAPVAQTQWNKEHSHPWNRLNPRFPWGIVLHWYGDKDNFDRSVPGYLRGFDSLRKIDNLEGRTSAHFLVGDAYPIPGPVKRDMPIGILQTQLPDSDGTPFLASHLRPLNTELHKEHKQYFVEAFYLLRKIEPTSHSLLEDLFDGPRSDPNLRTIAIEIAGHNFENPVYMPSEQKIANVIALVWALMKRYRIPASHILGHNELTMGKPDPGKKFLALMRYLIGLKALVEKDANMKQLVFGQYLDQDLDLVGAVRKYFKLLRQYLVLISHPRSVYEWEAASNYWLVNRFIQGHEPLEGVVYQWVPPLQGMTQTGLEFLIPANHEGVDLIADLKGSRSPAETRLSASGECVYTGRSKGGCPGIMAMFRHRQGDGTQVLTVYNHLEELGNYQPGQWVPQGARVGTLESRCQNPFLHFAIAYGATWETDLRKNPDVPRNAGPAWIRQRYLPPAPYVNGLTVPVMDRQENSFMEE